MQQFLLAWYAVLWVATALRPIDRQDWAMENVLVVFVVGALIITYKRFPLSDLSYVLITAFLTIHAIGAHYSYARVPAGFWMQHAFHFSRNHFDRVAHCAFGLLIAYPFREIFLRVARTREFWAYYLPIDVTLAFSALFEIFESWVAKIVNPSLGELYLGSQGDVWDAQEDMTAAFVGAVVCMALTAVLRKRFRKPKTAIVERELTAVSS